MNENLTKICRICLTEGSRHIFQKTVTNDALYNVSSLNRISEKLRYVTLLKIDEMENLPPMICDLCIVQLNVAYNFKRQATESDTKLRQYLIENGIDIMKDIRALPAIRGSDQIAVPERLPNRTIQRLNSTSSSSIFEVPQSTKPNGRVFEPRLVPIRIKVETPETVEPTSETGDLLSNSTISPLSSVTNGTAPVALPSPHISPSKTNSTENIAMESSPSSSKNSLPSKTGRDSAMVVVDSRNISLQSDEDYVQNILGSTSSLSTNTSKSVEKINSQPAKPKTSDSKEKNQSPEKSQERRLKTLLSALRINMVSSRFPQSKLRTKPRRKLQKLKLKEQNKNNPSPKPASKSASKSATKPPPKSVTVPKSVPNPVSTVARRHSLDLSQLLNGTRVKTEQKHKSPGKKGPLKKASQMISPSQLRSLRDKMREERDRLTETSKPKNKEVSTAASVGGVQKAHETINKTIS